MSSPRATDERAHLHTEATRRWDRLEQQHPELAEMVRFGRGLVALYIDALPGGGAVNLTVEQARAKLQQGVPLLEGEDADFDLEGLRHFCGNLCTWASDQPDLSEVAQRVQAATATDAHLPDQLLAIALVADDAALVEIANQLAVEPELLSTLTGFLLSAALMAAARTNEPLLTAANVPWDELCCPLCGGPPLLAELQGSGGERVLRCANCGTGWRTHIQRCAHCGNENIQEMHYLASEGQEEKYRVDLCNRCHGYLKSVTSFAPTPRELLPIEDAAMLHLDQAAQERGYSPTPELVDEG